MATLTIQKEQKTAQYFREKLGNAIELDMILVHGGDFLMGSPETEESHNNNESPQHSVTVKSFFLGRYPVTQEQWRIVAETYAKVNIELNPDPSSFKGDKRPVEQVSWYEAQEFCDRLAKKTNRPYRLPTEAEWEYACRAGTTTPFYFGNTISTELANYDGNYTYANGVKGEYRQETTPIDRFDVANAWGLCDMHGNVWEWCQDHWHDNYESAPKGGSAWLTDTLDAPRVRRGGSWNTNPNLCQSMYRNYKVPDVRLNTLGFRLSWTYLAQSDGVIHEETMEEKSSTVIKGVFCRKASSSFSVLRFYDDGLVISASIQVEDVKESWKKISKWFRRGYDNQGKYFLSGNRLRFSTTSSSGTVDYDGEYFIDKLILNNYSHINSNRATNEIYLRLTNLNSKDN
jgi:formylglycine-generating enzyme required for sulfatase activity